jgi:hypothetical protein
MNRRLAKLKNIEEANKRLLRENEIMGYGDDDNDNMSVSDAIEAIGLTPEEIEAMTSAYEDMGKINFTDKVEDIVNSESNEMSMAEGDEMSDREYKIRSAIDKIINKTSVIAGLGIVPAAMVAGGGAGVAAGVVSLTALLFKDAAWWNTKKGGHAMHDKQMNTARKDWYNKGIGEV